MSEDTTVPRGLTDEELASLPSVVDIVTAGRACGISRNHAYDLAHAGQFPVETLRIGKRFKVAKHRLINYLGAGDRVERIYARQMSA